MEEEKKKEKTPPPYCSLIYFSPEKGRERRTAPMENRRLSERAYMAWRPETIRPARGEKGKKKRGNRERKGGPTGSPPSSPPGGKGRDMVQVARQFGATGNDAGPTTKRGEKKAAGSIFRPRPPEKRRGEKTSRARRFGGMGPLYIHQEKEERASCERASLLEREKTFTFGPLKSPLLHETPARKKGRRHDFPGSQPRPPKS